VTPSPTRALPTPRAADQLTPNGATFPARVGIGIGIGIVHAVLSAPGRPIPIPIPTPIVLASGGQRLRSRRRVAWDATPASTSNATSNPDGVSVGEGAAVLAHVPI